MISWYISRLKAMSVAEIFFRIRQWIQYRIEKYFQTASYTNREITKTNASKLKLSFHIPSEASFPDTISIFGKSFNYNSPDINWHKDIFSGKKFPVVYSKSINIINYHDVSAKNVWEINRMQFLTFIALKYKKTRDSFYLNKFINIIKSWLKQNPYLIGINWYSNIEVNIRLIVWFYTWLILDVDHLVNDSPDFKRFVEESWLPSIYQHCKYSHSHQSKYSSSNNHLIAEYAGLFLATTLWKFKESEKWNRHAKLGLEKEIIRQHSENGINKEEAAEYIQFITDFFLLSYVVGEQSDNSFSKSYLSRFKKILKYIYHFLDINGNLPKYGDEDDGKCILFDGKPDFNNFKSLLTSGAILFHDPRFKSKSNGPDIKNLVLFGEEGIRKFHLLNAEHKYQESTFFPSEGHFIFRKQSENKEIYMHFDAAPLGFLSIAAHGHADALSFILHIDGQPLLVDPGTYTYHLEPKWRKYFVGTLAHNTIRINETDQAKNAGPTLWLNHYRTKVLSYDSTGDFDIVIANHDGYKSFGIIHTRKITFDKRKNRVIISDSIESRTSKSFLIEQLFHIHPQIQLDDNGSREFLLLNPNGRNVSIRLDDKLDNKAVIGSVKPIIMGWYSNSFLHKEQSITIIGSQFAKGNTSLETVIKIL